MQKSLTFSVLVLVCGFLYGQGRFAFSAGVPLQYLNYESEFKLNLGLKAQGIYYTNQENSCIFFSGDLQFGKWGYLGTETSSGGYPTKVINSYNEMVFCTTFGIGVHLPSKNKHRFLNIGIAVPPVLLAIKNGNRITQSPFSVVDTNGQSWINYRTNEEVFTNDIYTDVLGTLNLFIEYGNKYQINHKKYLTVKFGANVGSVYVLLGLEKITRSNKKAKSISFQSPLD